MLVVEESVAENALDRRCTEVERNDQQNVDALRHADWSPVRSRQNVQRVVSLNLSAQAVDASVMDREARNFPGDPDPIVEHHAEVGCRIPLVIGMANLGVSLEVIDSCSQLAHLCEKELERRDDAHQLVVKLVRTKKVCLRVRLHVGRPAHPPRATSSASDDIGSRSFSRMSIAGTTSVICVTRRAKPSTDEVKPP